MAYALTAPNGLLRSRDLFLHDGAQLRRIRLSAPVQGVFLLILLLLVGWCAYATAQLAARQPAVVMTQTAAAPAGNLEQRARLIEQRQAVIEAMLVGERVDPALLSAAAKSAALTADGPLGELEAAQVKQAAMVAQALEARYELTAEELKKLGLTPARVGATGTGGPYEPVKSADPTFKALFNSWKKLDQLQDSVIAVPADKPVRTAAFTSSFGVRSDPFRGSAAMHAGIDLAGPIGTPIYATADGTVSDAGWHNGGYGNLIKLDHGRGIETRYAHLSGILVRPGQRVKRGEVIGRMGSTGRSTGSHLHYEVRIDGRAVNPIPFMKSTDYLLAIRSRGNGPAMDQVALGGPTGGKR